MHRMLSCRAELRLSGGHVLCFLRLRPLGGVLKAPGAFPLQQSEAHTAEKGQAEATLKPRSDSVSWAPPGDNHLAEEQQPSSRSGRHRPHCRHRKMPDKQWLLLPGTALTKSRRAPT